jgi:hypothetical protein
MSRIIGHALLVLNTLSAANIMTATDVMVFTPHNAILTSGGKAANNV